MKDKWKLCKSRKRVTRVESAAKWASNERKGSGWLRRDHEGARGQGRDKEQNEVRDTQESKVKRSNRGLLRRKGLRFLV